MQQPGTRGGDCGDERPARPPRSDLARLREEQRRGNPEVRAAIMDAMLLCCGEIGYRRVTVEQVCRRYGGDRSQFYRYFENKADCFVAAFEAETQKLCERLLSTGHPKTREEDWLRSTLDRLAGFVEEQPARARALFLEVHVAGGDALVRRRDVVEQMAGALDEALRAADARCSPPSLTAEFMVCVIDQAVTRALVGGRPEAFAEDVTDLTGLICQTYRGEPSAPAP